MESIFKIVLIILDAVVIATIDDNKISKLFGVLAIIFLSISLLGA